MCTPAGAFRSARICGGAIRRNGLISPIRTQRQLKDALEEGAVDRVRPKLMTVFTTTIGLFPIKFGTETGSEVMKRIATPMVGCLVTSSIHTLIMIPALYAVVHGLRLRRKMKQDGDMGEDQGDGRAEGAGVAREGRVAGSTLE